jgi:hypothetical protein
MAITLAGLVDFAKRFSDDANTNYADEMYLDLVNDAIAQTFNAARWPFLEAESSLAMIVPYETGTITVNGTTAVTGAATVWDTAWPAGSVLEIAGDPNQYVVTVFGSTTTLTLDKAVQRSNASGLTYTINFPAYDLPSDMLEMGPPQRTTWNSCLLPINFEEYLHQRQGVFWAGMLQYYAVVPGDGTTGPKLYLYPAPGFAELIRFNYRKRFDRGVLYKAGTASVTTATTAVTGVGTAWQKMGFSASGLVLQFVDSSLGLLSSIQGTISGAASSDTAMTLSANWGGATQATASYRLSSKLTVPDLMLPCLRAAIKHKVAEIAGNFTGMEAWDAQWHRELATALGALAPHGSFRRQPAGGSAPAITKEPPIPRLVVRV